MIGFAVFTGTCMSTTALPDLSQTLTEDGTLDTVLGAFSV